MAHDSYIPLGNDFWDDEPKQSMTILESDDGMPVKTGLLDAQGVPLYRVRERIPFGFVGR